MLAFSGRGPDPVSPDKHVQLSTLMPFLCMLSTHEWSHTVFRACAYRGSMLFCTLGPSPRRTLPFPEKGQLGQAMGHLLVYKQHGGTLPATTNTLSAQRRSTETSVSYWYSQKQVPETSSRLRAGSKKLNTQNDYGFFFSWELKLFETLEFYVNNWMSTQKIKKLDVYLILYIEINSKFIKHYA